MQITALKPDTRKRLQSGWRPEGIERVALLCNCSWHTAKKAIEESGAEGDGLLGHIGGRVSLGDRKASWKEIGTVVGSRRTAFRRLGAAPENGKWRMSDAERVSKGPVAYSQQNNLVDMLAWVEEQWSHGIVPFSCVVEEEGFVFYEALWAALERGVRLEGDDWNIKRLTSWDLELSREQAQEVLGPRRKVPDKLFDYMVSRKWVDEIWWLPERVDKVGRGCCIGGDLFLQFWRAKKAGIPLTLCDRKLYENLKSRGAEVRFEYNFEGK